MSIFNRIRTGVTLLFLTVFVTACASNTPAQIEYRTATPLEADLEPCARPPLKVADQGSLVLSLKEQAGALEMCADQVDRIRIFFEDVNNGQESLSR